MVPYKIPEYMYTTVLIQDQRDHLGVADCQLEFRYCQLGSLAVHIGSLQHPVDEGGGRGLRGPLRWKGGAARHRGSTRRRAVPLRGRPLDGPPLAGAAADADVRRHLLQDCRPSVPEPAATPAAERPDEQVGGGIMDEAHSPKNNFQQSGKIKMLFEQKPQVTGADPKETTG